MTLSIHLRPNLEERLSARAQEVGVPLEQFIEELLEREARILSFPEAESGQAAREQAGRSIRELRKGNTLGNDITIRDLIEEGRRF